jgi:hypothetical protein
MLAEHELNLKNMISIGTDGTSSMTEKHNGLVAQLQKEDHLEWLVGVHCACHKAHLAAQASVHFTDKEKKAGVDKLLRPMDEVRRTLNATAHFIKGSPKQSRVYESLQSTKHKYRMPVPAATRWASAATTADAVLSNRKTIIATLERAKKEERKVKRREKIDSLLKELNINEFVIKAAVYTEVNKVISRFIKRVCVCV